MALIARSKCRSLMIFNKQFLAELYESNKFTSRKILLIASDSQIKLLLYLLHFIANGEIPLSQESHDSISKAKKAFGYTFQNLHVSQKHNPQPILSKYANQAALLAQI